MTHAKAPDPSAPKTLAHHVVFLDENGARPLIVACTDIRQVSEALTVARALKLGFAIVDPLEDRLARLTGLLTSETKLTASELCGGELDEHLIAGITQIIRRVQATERESGAGQITLTIRVGVEEHGNSMKLAVEEPKIKLPKMLAKGQIARVKLVKGDDGTAAPLAVVDRAETIDRNRSLFSDGN